MESRAEKCYRCEKDCKEAEESDCEEIKILMIAIKTQIRTENDEVDPCEKRREEVINYLDSTLREHVEVNQRHCFPKDTAQIQASNYLSLHGNTRAQHINLLSTMWLHS